MSKFWARAEAVEDWVAVFNFNLKEDHAGRASSGASSGSEREATSQRLHGFLSSTWCLHIRKVEMALTPGTYPFGCQLGRLRWARLSALYWKERYLLTNLASRTGVGRHRRQGGPSGRHSPGGYGHQSAGRALDTHRLPSLPLRARTTVVTRHRPIISARDIFNASAFDWGTARARADINLPDSEDCARLDCYLHAALAALLSDMTWAPAQLRGQNRGRAEELYSLSLPLRKPRDAPSLLYGLAD